MTHRAVEAAVEVVRRYGLGRCDPVSLRSTNNIVLWMRPTAIVAKVGVGHHPGFEHEVVVAAALVSLGAPVVSPATELPAIVHRQDGFPITFWTYCPQQGDMHVTATELASVLHRLHLALRQISTATKTAMPSYHAELETVATLLCNPERTPALEATDRTFLLRVFALLDESLQAVNAERHMAIHGSLHSFNLLRVDGEVRFIDFETVCVGPLEWDLAHTASETASAYPGAVDHELLAVCADMVRLKTAAWCWKDVDNGDLRYHAHVHLGYLKQTYPDLA